MSRTLQGQVERNALLLCARLTDQQKQAGLIDMKRREHTSWCDSYSQAHAEPQKGSNLKTKKCRTPQTAQWQ
eukprot:760849-Rhodomonas_salina.2